MFHSPFFTFNQKRTQIQFGSDLVSCNYDEDEINKFKLFYSIADSAKVRLHTGLGDLVPEFSPTAWQDEDGWHLSFISGGEVKKRKLFLNIMHGKNLAQMEGLQMVYPCRAGFVYKDRVVSTDSDDAFLVSDSFGNHKFNVPGFFIMRIAYCCENPDILFIYGIRLGSVRPMIIEFNLTNSEQNLISCPPTSIYNLVICGDLVLSISSGENDKNNLKPSTIKINKSPIVKTQCFVIAGKEKLSRRPF